MVTNSVIVVHLSDRQSQSLNHFSHNKMLHTFFHLKHSSHLNTTNCLITFYTLNLSLDLKGFVNPFFKFYHVFIEIINWKFTFFPRIWLFKCKLYYCHITYDLIVWNIKKIYYCWLQNSRNFPNGILFQFAYLVLGSVAIEAPIKRWLTSRVYNRGGCGLQQQQYQLYLYYSKQRVLRSVSNIIRSWITAVLTSSIFLCLLIRMLKNRYADHKNTTTIKPNHYCCMLVMKVI